MIRSHRLVNTTAKAFVVSFICFQPTKTPLEDRNCYADKLVFSKLYIAVILTLNTPKANDVGTAGVRFHYVSIQADRN